MNTTTHTRSEQLSPLSVEHKDGMEFVNRIRDHIGKISNDRLCDYTCWFWKNHIRPHFYQEERILLPMMPENHPLANQLKEEHFYIREMILALEKQADKGSFYSLCDFLEKHIRFEEVEVFAFLEDTLTLSELNEIAGQLAQHPVEECKWNDVFWK